VGTSWAHEPRKLANYRPPSITIIIGNLKHVRIGGVDSCQIIRRSSLVGTCCGHKTDVCVNLHLHAIGAFGRLASVHALYQYQRMLWHTVPRNDAWREVTIGKAAMAGEMLWVHCYCGRQRLVLAVDLMAETGCDPDTPCLALAMRFNCTACGHRRVLVWRAPQRMAK
jgi:hypothetical protein